MGKLLNIKYSGIHAAYWMHYGIVTSFASAFLLVRGYTNGEIGIILAAGSVLAVFLQPLLADVADRSKKISIMGITQISTVLLMVLTMLLFVLMRKTAALWLVYVLIVAWNLSIQPLFNSMAFKLEETGVHINFGICRAIGSLGYSVLCSFLGTLVAAKGVQVLPLSGEIVLAVLLFTLIITKVQFDKMKKARGLQEPAEEKLPDVPDADAAGEKGEEINLWLFMKRNKLFVVMNLACIGIFFGNSILNNFMLQVVEGVGGDSGDMGRILSVMAFLEIPALVLFDRINKKFSCEFLLRVGAVCFTLKILLIYLADSVTMLYVAHIFQTFSFGLFLPAMVIFINKIMARGEAVKGQALYTVMTTVATVIASVLGGFILDIWNAESLLLLCTAASAVGTVAVVFIIGKISRKNI